MLLVSIEPAVASNVITISLASADLNYACKSATNGSITMIVSSNSSVAHVSNSLEHCVALFTDTLLASIHIKTFTT